MYVPSYIGQDGIVPHSYRIHFLFLFLGIQNSAFKRKWNLSCLKDIEKLYQYLQDHSDVSDEEDSDDDVDDDELIGYLGDMKAREAEEWENEGEEVTENAVA